jgi:hypothetical protein
MGFALQQIGFPLGFTAAGSSALIALLLFFSMMREEQGNDTAGNITEN